MAIAGKGGPDAWNRVKKKTRSVNPLRFICLMILLTNTGFYGSMNNFFEPNQKNGRKV